ncbi:MAG: right-handed parallel beta-helix repeat-containing protein [Oscillospiraceae bacterium]|nr:right-handed parallel beta-helix repeat-containing protein [Oscillospiraceae bacterium]
METLLSLTLSGSALALLLLLLKKLLGRRLSSTLYYYAWLLVLLRFLLPLPGLVPLGQEANSSTPSHLTAPRLPEETDLPVQAELPAPAPLSELPVLTPVLPEADGQAAGSVPAPSPAAAHTLSIDWRSPILWLSLWALGTGLCFLWPLVSYLRFRRSLRPALREPEPALCALYARIPGRKPALSICTALQTPLMFGVFSPRIVLPQGISDPETLENVLRHELCHYRRRDPLYKWFAVLVLSLHWFNPLSWLIRRELNRACELSCDETLLRSMDRERKQSYGETLLRMAASAALPAGVVATTFSTEKKDLKERLEQIMHYKHTKGRVLAALLALLLLCGCGAAAGPAAGREASLVPKEENVTEVSTVDELLSAIAPNATLVLAEGDYDLSTAADYGRESANPYYAWVPVHESVENTPGFELQILGADGLTLRGAGEGKTTLAAVPRYANVLHFLNCTGVRVEGLTAGHTTAPGFCNGGVLYFDVCSDIAVSDCGLFGCGTIGVQARDCHDLSVTGCHIYECSYSAVNVHSCRNVLVESCQAERNGRKPETGPAYSLFSADFTDGFTVLNCRVHDNACQTLLNTANSKNALFLSNRVENNSFHTCLFQMQQYPATVDGCAFTDNEVASFIYGGGIFPVDMDGNALDPAALQAMEYRKLDPAKVQPPVPAEEALELPVGGSVTVKTVDEFLKAIGPDRTILLDGELFDLSTASSYGGVGGKYYYWAEGYDGPALIITDVSGLTIRGASGDPKAVTLAAVPRYANVLAFRNCSNISLADFTAGHTQEPGSCSGGVLYFTNCHGIDLDRCRLYGCGVLGLDCDGCTGMAVRDCEIYECSQGGVHLARTDGVRFLNCDIHDVPSPALYFFNSGDLSWNGEPLSGTRFDLDADGKPLSLDFEPGESAGEGYAVAYAPFQILDPGRFREGETLDFARAVQQNIAEGNWEALSTQLCYPFPIFTGTDSLVSYTPEDFLALDLDALMPPSYRQEIADAPLDAYGASELGNTFCGGRLAFARMADAAQDLRLIVIALEGSMPESFAEEALELFYYDNQLSEFTLSEGESVRLDAVLFPLGRYPEDGIVWICENDTALKLTPDADGRSCTLEVLKAVPGGIKLTVRYKDLSKTITVYTRAAGQGTPPTPVP